MNHFGCPQVSARSTNGDSTVCDVFNRCSRSPSLKIHFASLQDRSGQMHDQFVRPQSSCRIRGAGNSAFHSAYLEKCQSGNIIILWLSVPLQHLFRYKKLRPSYTRNPRRLDDRKPIWLVSQILHRTKHRAT